MNALASDPPISEDPAITPLPSNAPVFDTLKISLELSQTM
jgi:hypothetical protein